MKFTLVSARSKEKRAIKRRHRKTMDDALDHMRFQEAFRLAELILENERARVNADNEINRIYQLQQQIDKAANVAKGVGLFVIICFATTSIVCSLL